MSKAEQLRLEYQRIDEMLEQMRQVYESPVEPDQVQYQDRDPIRSHGPEGVAHRQLARQEVDRMSPIDAPETLTRDPRDPGSEVVSNVSKSTRDYREDPRSPMVRRSPHGYRRRRSRAPSRSPAVPGHVYHGANGLFVERVVVPENERLRHAAENQKTRSGTPMPKQSQRSPDPSEAAPLSLDGRQLDEATNPGYTQNSDPLDLDAYPTAIKAAPEAMESGDGATVNTDDWSSDQQLTKTSTLPNKG